MKITVIETIDVPSELKYSSLGFHFFDGNFAHPRRTTNEDSRNFQKTESGYIWEEYRPYGSGWIAPNGCGHQAHKWFKIEYAAKIEII